ncbi:hypothetical protein [Streptomyces sp. NPDC088816]|uniref:hypothetical protein n=1 Tax=Streptomyces sp. NPDC088816 TaxID=3365906 RepID=UPI0038043E5C
MNASSQTSPGAPPPEPPAPLVPVSLPEAFRAATTTTPPPPAAPAPAAEVVAPVSTDVPHRLRARAPEPDGPECFTCGTDQSLLYPDPRGRHYDSGAHVLYCGTHVPDTTPVQAATKVMDAAMENGSATPRELAQAEHDAGLLFDPQRAQDIADNARTQAHLEFAAELGHLRQGVATLSHFKQQLDGIRRALSGRPDNDLVFVREVLAAADPQAPESAPLTLTWNGTAQVPDAHTTHKRVIVECTSSYGGRVDLVVDGDDRMKLASLLDSEVIRDINAPCLYERGCGSDHDLDGTDVFGWFRLEVAGIEGGPRWYCSPGCVNAAMLRAGDDLALADQSAAIAPADQATDDDPPVQCWHTEYGSPCDWDVCRQPERLAAGDRGTDPAECAATPSAVEGAPRCVRCGCTDSQACVGGCHWVANRRGVSLCSTCATSTELALSGGAL